MLIEILLQCTIRVSVCLCDGIYSGLVESAPSNEFTVSRMNADQAQHPKLSTRGVLATHSFNGVGSRSIPQLALPSWVIEEG